MKRAVLAILVFISLAACGQHKVNLVLKKQLDSIMVLDQKYRDTLSLLMDPKKSDSVAKNLSLTAQQATGHYWALQNRLDSLDLVFVEGVIKKYGYPGKTLVDSPANEAAWYVIQHTGKIHQYIDVIKKAADNNELPFHLYAMMLDRDLMDGGKEQVYGTQAAYLTLKNGHTEWFVWPIKDAATVNERRKKAGFDLTVEQNATRFDITYKVVELNGIKKIK